MSKYIYIIMLVISLIIKLCKDENKEGNNSEMVYSNGRLKVEGYFQNGEKKGLWRAFDNTGNIEGEESY